MGSRNTSALREKPQQFYIRSSEVFSEAAIHTFFPLYKQYKIPVPHLEFASQAWAQWTVSDKEKFEKRSGKCSKNSAWSQDIGTMQ
jgi:hypothetical protein